MNIIIAGPCGIGKSTISRYYADKVGIVFLDFDEIRGTEIGKSKLGFSPCSVSYLNLKECLQSKLDTISGSFILDIGGDTVFRPNADNNDRKNQVVWLKTAYSAKIVVLIAERDILFQRFAASKDRNLVEFDALWSDWLSIGEPCWRRCADIVVDTTSLTISDTIQRIEEGTRI